MLSLNKNSAPGISIAPWFQNGRTLAFTFLVPDRSPEEEAMLEEIRGTCPGPLLRGAVDLPWHEPPGIRQKPRRSLKVTGGSGLQREKDTPSLMVGAKTAARITGVSFRTWCRLDATGRCPAPVRIGKRVLWRLSDLAAWTAAGCPCRESSK